MRTICKKFKRYLFKRSIAKYPVRRFQWDCYARATITVIKRIEQMTYDEILSLPLDESDAMEWIEEVKGMRVALEVNVIYEQNPERLLVFVINDIIPPLSCLGMVAKSRYTTIFKHPGEESLQPASGKDKVEI